MGTRREQFLRNAFVILTFPVPAISHPIGGVAVIYDFATSMLRRGHEVHLLHYPHPRFAEGPSSTDDISWYEFPEGLEHRFLDPGPVTADAFPSADIIFGYSNEHETPAHAGLPVVFIQGHKMLYSGFEENAYHAPCPKVCVAKWLVRIALEKGVPRDQLVHIPLGLRHDQFRVVTPIDDRPPRVSFCYNTHPQKGAAMALDVLARVKQRLPEIEAAAFGAMHPEHALPEGVGYRVNPSPRELVEDIYNQSRVFLCTSEVEGFGLPSLEAMACGAALVTTDNGGREDYALHDRTALVVPRGDRTTMTEYVIGLLRDDERRADLVAGGLEGVSRFDWDRSAETLEMFLERYLADPASLGYRPMTAP